MISNSRSPSYLLLPAVLSTPLPLSGKSLPVAVNDKISEGPSAPRPAALPRLRRSMELENPRSDEGALMVGQSIGRWQELTGNIQNNRCLVTVLQQILEDIAKDPILDVATLLEAKKSSIHEYSTFARAYGIGPGEEDSVAWFLRENQLLVPTGPAQLANLIAVLKQPLPEPAEYGNHWGLLNQPDTLDSEQRTTLSAMARAEMLKLSPGNGIFRAFYEKHGTSFQGMSAAQVLEHMMCTAELKGLGQTLQAAFNNAQAGWSAEATDWALTAMILELDPLAGSKRGVVAGYDLYQQANRDVHPSVVVAHLEQHLVDEGKVPAEMAPAAARMLLAGSEPAFVVADTPSNMVVKSAAFAQLSAVVQAQEFWLPGIATHSDFTTFMRLAELGPITAAEVVIEAKSQASALIQWGIAQGKIDRRDDDDYTVAEVAKARTAFDQELTALKKVHEQLSAPMPVREGIATANLHSVYGTGPFDVRNTRIVNIDASESEEHSLVHIYMSGKMDRIPKGERYDFQIGNRFLRVRPLPDVNAQFNTQFDQYFNNLKEVVTTLVKHQLGQLPLEDRQTIASGRVEFFSLRKASVAEAEGEESEAQAQAAKGRFGLLMRVLAKIDPSGSDRDEKNLRHVYYEVFPLQGTVRRRDDLPRYLPNPPPRVANAETYATKQAKGVSVAVDYEAYESSTSPLPGKVSQGLLTQRLDGPYLREPRPGRDANAADAINARFDTVAGVVAGHLLHDREAMQAGARGVTKVEEEEADIKAGHDFVKGLIPLANAIENAAKGNVGAAISDLALDIFGFIVPVGKGVSQVYKTVGNLSGKLGSRVFKAFDKVLRSTVSGLNPADGLGDLAQSLARGGKSVLKSSYREIKQILQRQPANVGGVGKLSSTASDVVDAGRQLPDYSAHAMPEHFLEGRTIRGDGTYQVGEDFYINFTDGTGNSRAFQVERHYKGGHSPVRVIDPQTKHQVMILVPTGHGEWRLGRMHGGAPDPSEALRLRAPKRLAGQGSSASLPAPSTGANIEPPVLKRPRVIEAFPGEKALLAPPVKGKNQFYHYTGKRSHDSIVREWSLQSSGLTVDGKPLSKGQGRHYFTDLAPEDMATQGISETIFGRRRYGNALDKMTHYYEINTSGLTMMKTDNPHIFYVDTMFDIPLKYRVNSELTSRIIAHGETLYTGT